MFSSKLPFAIGSVLLCLSATKLVLAQSQSGVGNVERDARPGPDRPALPSLDEETEPGFELPPVLPETKRPRASSGVEIVLSGIDFEGNTVFGDEELLEVAAPFVRQRISTSDLLELRDQLTRHYIDRGYVNSGAVIPDQTIDGGRIVVQIVEGQLNDISPLGLTRLDPTFVKDRIRYGQGPVLNVDQLRERIELLLLDPSVERLDARLNPGDRPGESRLLLDLDEAPPHLVELVFANNRSPSVGAERGEVTFTYVNATGQSDLLSLGFGLSEGTHDLSFSYDRPLLPNDLRAFISGSYGETEVVEEPFNAIDIESETVDVGAGLSLPLIRSTRQTLRTDAVLDYKRSRTFLAGQPTSFSAGAEDGRSVVTALRFGQNWRLRERDQALVLRSTLSAGLNLFGATQNNRNEPDGQFFSWLGQAQYAKRLFSSDWQTTFRADVQLTPDPLLAIEQIGIGGSDTVRGYRQNELVFDNGWVVSAGLKVPVWQLTIPGTATSPEDGRIFVGPFVDAGGGWNNERDDGDINELVSIGIGAEWKITDQANFQLDAGLPLIDTGSPEGDDLQDFGIHFRLSTALSGGDE